MKDKVSSYTLQFQCDSSLVNQLMQSYLSANGFKPHQKKNNNYYRAGDSIIGYRGLNYFINGNLITINAWIDGSYKTVSLENNFNILGMDYRNSLSILFQEIEKLSNNTQQMNYNSNMEQVNQGYQMNFDPNTGQPINQVNYNQPMYSQIFQNDNLTKNEKMCEISFWLSIVGLICSFFGITIGLIIYIFNFYFAFKGLKTRKRGKAIGTIIISSISTVIIFLLLMMTIMS